MEIEHEDELDEEDELQQKEIKQSSELDEQEPADEMEEEESVVNEIGVFFPDLDVILWRREKADQPGVLVYLVKYKDYSYLHLEWIEEDEIIHDSKGGKNKLKRFNKVFERKMEEGDFDPEMIENGKYFDQTYIEVDRVLHTTELFPVKTR